MKKIGLALGGGGVAGGAHLGVLLALEEANVQIDCLTGTSVGAIIASLYAYGITSSQLIKLIPTIGKHYLDFDYWSILRSMGRQARFTGLIKGKRLRNMIAKKTRNVSMSQLKMPVAFLATDIIQAKPVIFSSRPLHTDDTARDIVTDILLADAVQASFSIPILFQPVMYRNRMFVDGGLLENCPVDAARLLGADKVIAVNLVFANPVRSRFDSLSSLMTRVININLATQSKSIRKKADFVLHPEVDSIDILDFSKLELCIQIGYTHTQKQISEIKNLIT
ncbi:patatin-like phospholipase family protein [Effusibacillus dendaii]|uniref:PNPLA domain-containing protein n=1 Tax=Effusibacillus dendaii TaxID=2743772 RepID=A0A7I8DCU2_9BACL|nr:patatin-like phospholipase family protein [Effusibacillus dendaii]BCJ87847.1 hypothetical protein skT53_28320 [Effusibacillus dendaii]